MDRLRFSPLRVLAPALATAVAIAACSGSESEPVLDLSQAVSSSSVEPVVVADNPSCDDLGLADFAFKVEPPSSGTYDLDGDAPGTDTATVTKTGLYFDWVATMGIDAVIVKGGPNANVYVYDPEATGDTGLHAPINPENGTPYGLSHIDFCFDYNVAVEKSANTSYTRTYSWGIDKSGDSASLLLSRGQTYMMGYDVVVSVTGHTDSAWAAAGNISIYNPAPVAATITGVSDMMSGMSVAVDCGVTFPHSLAPYATLSCSYSTALPDASARVNSVEVATTGMVGGGSDTADVVFGAPTTEVDDCVDVTDDKYGSLGFVCVDGAPETFEYSLAIGPYAECGEFDFVNVASFETNDSSTEGSDSWTVHSTVPCPSECTLTPGYWKTHSELGPAPYDDNWANLSGGASTSFFLSGQSWYEVLWTSPQGNAYYILAHAYIAAKLNGLNGADTSAVASALSQAEALFATYTPEQVGALRGNKWQRSSFLTLATLLDNYNNGLTGPGHCSE